MFQRTPVVAVEHPAVELHAKLEFHNPIGSIKDRAAYWMLRRAIERGEVTERSTIVESSSGNLAIALAAFCRLLGLEFIPVIDPNITPAYESVLRRWCRTLVRVEERDATGGYLLTRLAAVEKLCETVPFAYWTNQYANRDSVEAHYQLTGGEIAEQLPRLDAIFIGVSTGGTLAGVSRRMRERFPGICIIAVDAVGSVIFGGSPRKRHLPGLGSSIVPGLLGTGAQDEVIHVAERDAASACRALFHEHGIFAGGSSGSAFHAARTYPWHRTADGRRPVALFLCADGGAPYLDTLYDDVWTQRLER